MNNNNNIFGGGLRGSSILNTPSVNKPYIPTKSGYDLTKAGKNGVWLYAILDESGSMGPYQDATIEGFNGFVDSQRKAEGVGEGYLTTTKFDAPSITKLYVKRPLNEVPLLDRETYKPRGGTNLNDAIGSAIADINNTLAAMSEEQRPGVMILIMTDGEENASNMFNANEVKNLVRSAEDSDWTFTFLGANIDAFAVGNNLGFRAQNTAEYNVGNMLETMTVVSATATNVRSAKAAGLNTAEIYSSGMMYSDSDRTKMKSNTK